MTAIWAFLSSPLGRRIALIGGLLVGLWALWAWHGREVDAASRAGFVAGYSASQALNRSQVDVARARLEAERAANLVVGQALSDRLDALRARLDAIFREAEKEARDAAPTDPVCAPSERSLRVWNDAADRASRAAAGADAE